MNANETSGERYLPSPTEIAAACAAIRADWSDTERRGRLRGYHAARLDRILSRRRFRIRQLGRAAGI